MSTQTADTHVEQEQIKKQLVQIYTPSVPITDPKLFSGRNELLEALRDQLLVEGKVFILYGERGVGKTSFINVLLHDRKSVKYSCTSKDTFITIFLNILRSLGEHLTETETTNLVEAGYEVGTENVFKLTGKGSVQEKETPILPEPLDQASILRRLKNVQAYVDTIVFDEFQKVKDTDIHAQMNDLVKALSDQQVKVRIIFAGIAESDEELLPPDKDYAEYKIRHYMAVRIPRMTAEEIEDIINRRKNLYNIEFTSEVKTELAKISSGYPSVAHTLALYSCYAWLSANAATLVRNWFAKHFGWLIGATELKVAEIHMNVEEKEFALGIVQFLKVFRSSYEAQSKLLVSGLTSSHAEAFQRLLLLLARKEEKQPTNAIATLLGMSRVDLLKILAPYPGLIIRDEADHCRLGFSHLRVVVQAYDYLRRKYPEQFGNLLKSAVAMA